MGTTVNPHGGAELVPTRIRKLKTVWGIYTPDNTLGAACPHEDPTHLPASTHWLECPASAPALKVEIAPHTRGDSVNENGACWYPRTKLEAHSGLLECISQGDRANKPGTAPNPISTLKSRRDAVLPVSARGQPLGTGHQPGFPAAEAAPASSLPQLPGCFPALRGVSCLASRS